ncbi:MAG: hypothetical protein M3P93_13475, partial [Actinomycetota bacterium]|nr:hypothetical protein [Actinomycetota bacterium]
QAEEDVRSLHDRARAEAAAVTRAAQAEVQEAARQRDVILAELQSLYGKLGGAVAPLAGAQRGGSVRADGPGEQR